MRYTATSGPTSWTGRTTTGSWRPCRRSAYPRPGGRATKLEDLAVYMRGVRFASRALADRARDPFDRAEAERTSKMAERFVAAQGATLRATAGRSASDTGGGR